LEIRPNRGGFLRPFGCGWFIREYLLGNGPEGSHAIDPERGAAQADRIYERELKRVSRKFTHMRYHSFLMYFGVLKRLGWVETTSETEPSAMQDNYPPAPQRTYYRLTKKGIEAGDEFWSNPLFTLYPDIGPSHMKKD